MSVPGVLLPSSALRSSTTFRGIRSVVVVTGTTASLVSALVTTVLAGRTVALVSNTSCVAGAHSLRIPPSASVTTAISPVFYYCNVFTCLNI